mmetsp:Transcript_4006/g.7582  ORF Transcript_4006/g.7582 Transcript_4006/m.7582 type:complete len:455 (+) Transcript_4006:195-1559(+)
MLPWSSKPKGSKGQLLTGGESRAQISGTESTKRKSCPEAVRDSVMSEINRQRKKKNSKGKLLGGKERRDELSTSPKKDEGSKMFGGKKNLSEVMFGHDNSHLGQVNLEDDAFADWYRKTAGMHTVETWLSNYKRHPYAWGALIMIHGVDEVSARLRSKVENYAVYSAVLLSASVVMLIMPEINEHFLDAHWVYKRIFLYSMCISVASHLTSILLSMAFVNALNEAGRDSDVIRMFGEGQGFLATDKCSKAFSAGIASLAIGILDMVLINFTILDMIACAIISSCIMYKIVPTSRKLFGSSSLVAYWRWGVGKDGEIGSRAIDNEDPFDLRIPMERVREKARISERLYNILQGKLTLENYKEFYGLNNEKEGKKGEEDGRTEGDRDLDEAKSVEEEEEVDEKVEVKIISKNSGGRPITTSNHVPRCIVKNKESPLRAKWQRRTTAVENKVNDPPV